MVGGTVYFIKKSIYLFAATVTKGKYPKLTINHKDLTIHQPVMEFWLDYLLLLAIVM